MSQTELLRKVIVVEMALIDLRNRKVEDPCMICINDIDPIIQKIGELKEAVKQEIT